MHVKKASRKRKANDQAFTVLIEQDEDGFYVATVPALKSCYTQAKSVEAEMWMGHAVVPLHEVVEVPMVPHWAVRLMVLDVTRCPGVVWMFPAPVVASWMVQPAVTSFRSRLP